ncbi:neutral/alkaline non-lysosomal ceramidase N-terminal domain-containing protein [Schlesneria sp.]|uniref:neutral/alkaline non-lysosomal ceramidase N-terminal domain-containing protein n=1 Tax=Schlesneria sp. TaxID=2762018 RepID=UPI002EE7793C
MVRFLIALRIVCVISGLSGLGQLVSATESTATYSVGVSQADVTPEYPVRLSGFGFRRTESEGVTQPIWAKALAISANPQSDPVVLVTVDNLGIPASMCDEVASRLKTKAGLKRANLSITASHTHTAPMLRGVAPTLFSVPIPEDHWKQIDRYTQFLTDRIEEVALEALANREESKLTWGIGTVKFAINRRQQGGPVDHDLPVLVVTRPDGVVRAIYVDYACHCVTLSNNKVSGDWAGYAQDLIQRAFPSAIALVSVGCGADQNPSSGVVGDRADIAMQQGAEIAAEVKRMIRGFMTPVQGPIQAVRESVPLDYDTLPTRAEWEKRAEKDDPVGYHALVQLERLNRGEKLPTTLDYPIVTWSFGDSLAMVFLPGEVVVDYSLRLKRELDRMRIWVNAYANDAPCYIPSERILREGGYEGGGAMVYYDRPAPFKPGLEDRIIRSVRGQLDEKFAARFDAGKTSGTLPKSPHQSLAALETTSNLRVDLVVAEPLIADPVAIDFGLNGELWVAEMSDYPNTFISLQGSEGGAPTDSVPPPPGGRIRLVRDTDGDGQFDRSTIFLDKIAQPTGVTVWRKGVLICAAPDLLYAEDTDGDDEADRVQKLFTGFGTSNNQARLNSLTYGLDGWIYGSCGLFGGSITNLAGKTVELGDRDFRIKPETGEIEAATGRTQQGRIRDEFGNWFGCDNSTLGYHYPLAEHYLRRNPYVTSPISRVNLAQSEETRRLYPARPDAQRFQLSGAPGTVTAACGIAAYRDSVLGADYQNHLFICEPVNLLVHRFALKPTGTSFVAERPANEAETEFLRSTDGWFRPVQVVNGPDGAIWVVDMYRFIIEDPRWIPKQELDPLDLRAGTTLGRIYRVTSQSDQSKPATRALPRTDRSGTTETKSPLLSVYQERELHDVISNGGKGTRTISAERVKSWRDESQQGNANLRVMSYRRLAAASQLTAADIQRAFSDPDPRVRAVGLVLAEGMTEKGALIDSLLKLSDDADPHVRLQVACSLGEWEDRRIGSTLAKMALRDAGDPYQVAAIFSSIRPGDLQAFTTTLFDELKDGEPPPSLMAPFLATAVGYGDDGAIKLALVAVSKGLDQQPRAWQLRAVTNLVESLRRRPADAGGEQVKRDDEVLNVTRRMQQAARSLIAAEGADDETRIAAIQLLGRDPMQQMDDVATLIPLLSSAYPPGVQLAAVEAFERIAADNVPEIFAERYRELSPSVQPRIVDAFLGRGKWTPYFFEKVADGTIPATSISAAQRQALISHPVLDIRRQAEKSLAASINTDRQQVVEQYREALTLKGDNERGRALFAKTCAQCHRLGDVGHVVGPNLAMVANKSPSFLLQELLDPNRNVDTRYIGYLAVTREGLIRTGLLASESSNSVTLLGPEGKQFTLLRKELEELRATAKSLMPEGLEKDLSPQAVADLIALLSSVSVPPKQAEGNTPKTVRPEEGRLSLLAATAAIYGNDIAFETPYGNIGYWHGVNDHVVWSIDLPEAGVFDVYQEYACDGGSQGNAFRIECGEKFLTGVVRGTGGWSNYVVTKVGSLSLDAGAHRLLLRPDGSHVSGALMDLRGVYLIPEGQPFALAKVEPVSPATDVKEFARQLLDDALSADDRARWITEKPEQASEIVAALVADLPDNQAEEYRRIPWIWRVAIDCGKRAEGDQLFKLLEVSLPKDGEPLRDWQAVVVGGGIINGISLSGGWPKGRILEILKDSPDLNQRWKRSLVLASEMSDNERVPTGTRYDALRMIAVDDWNRRRAQLVKYLAKGVNAELQMGSISGLSDVESSEVADLLLGCVEYVNEHNRTLALDALLRTDRRAEKLLDAIAGGQLSAARLSSAHRKSLLESKTSSIRERAVKLLKE